MSGPFEDFLDRYGPPAGEVGPLLFVEEVLGVVVDKWQADTLRAIGRGERRISIVACHGPGKTALAAWVVLYNLCCWFPQKSVATAPTRPQLEDALVSEVMAWFGKLPPTLKDLFEATKNRIELRSAPDESFFSARTARAETPEALQGIHSAKVTLIGDEAAAIPDPIFKAGQGSMSGHNAQTILLSNATRTSGYFHRTHHQQKHRWYTVQVAARDSPRVSAEFVREIAETWGEDSDEYRVRVLAEFPRSDLNTLISAGSVIDARKRDVIVPAGAAEVWALDVARFGDDSNALLRRNRLAFLPKMEEWSGRDLMETTGRLKRAYDDTAPHLRPEEILVDEIGLGAGVVDRGRELKLPVRGINVSESASAHDDYRNLRTELGFRLKEWLDSKNHKLPMEECCGKGHGCIHDRFAEQLCIPRYGYTSSGKYLLEPKDSIKKRGYKSPNLFDAAALTFASEPTTLLHGSEGGKGLLWNEPVRRGLSHV